LHQILVGGDDRAASAGPHRIAGEGGDDVVGLKAFGFKTGDVEGTGGFAGEGELRAQILGQVGAICLVGGIKGVARWVAALPELARDSSFHRMLQNPATAPTGRPSDLRVKGGSAW
jgi:hypothetical protein